LDYFNLPTPATKKRPLLNNIFIPKILYNSDYEDAFLFRPFSFYTYHGSLTRPPCSERTIVYVAADPIRLGSTALHLFQEAIRIPDVMTPKGDIISNNLPAENNRLTQPLNGRAIFYYDHILFCGKDKLLKKKKKIKKIGHYEKVLKKLTEYYYVNGPKPSGLPGAYVVPRSEAMGDYNDIYNK